MKAPTLIALSSILISATLNYVAFWLTKPPDWLQEEMEHLKELCANNGNWSIRTEGNLRALSQHQILDLIKLFYRELAFLRGVFVLIAFLQLASLMVYMALGADLWHESVFHVAILLLLIFALTVFAVAFIPWVLSRIFSGRANEGRCITD